MWFPKTALELTDAIDNGTLPREATAFEVKAQLPASKANPDLAIDVTAMATDGGVIIYGVAEDKAAGTFAANPIELRGVKERISEVVASHVSERIEFDVRELPLDSDPSKGFIVVEVPASMRAPHMVQSKGEYRFYGRIPGGNRVLSETEVARLYERRRSTEGAARRALEEACALAPTRNIRGRGDLFIVVVPFLSDAGLRERAMQGQTGPELFVDVTATCNTLRFRESWDPRFDDIVRGGHSVTTLDGISLLNGPILRDGVEIDRWVARLELLDDGTCRYFHAAIADRRGAPEEPFKIRDNAIAQMAAHACLFAGRILRRGEYNGAVEVLMAVEGVAGASSAQWDDGKRIPPFGPMPTVPSHEVMDQTRVPASKLFSEPIEVARSLTDRLLRTIRPAGFPDPLAVP